MASTSSGERTISRLEAVNLIACKALRSRICDALDTASTLKSFAETAAHEPAAMLPLSDVGFVYGSLNAETVHCPVHTGYSEVLFNAQASTYGIPAPPSNADAHGWFVQKSLHEAVLHAEERVKHLRHLANRREMDVVGQRRAVSTVSEAFHILTSAAKERGLAPLPASLFMSQPPQATPSAPPVPTPTNHYSSSDRSVDDIFADGFSDSASVPPATASRAAAAAPATPSGLDERIKARDDSALWRRMEELEAAEAAAGDEVVWSTGRGRSDMLTVDQDDDDDEDDTAGGASSPGAGGIMEIVEEEDGAGRLLRGQARAVPSRGTQHRQPGAVGAAAASTAAPARQPPASRSTAPAVAPVLERAPAAGRVASAASASADQGAVQASAPTRQSRFKQRMSQMRK